MNLHSIKLLEESSTAAKTLTAFTFLIEHLCFSYLTYGLKRQIL